MGESESVPPDVEQVIDRAGDPKSARTTLVDLHHHMIYAGVTQTGKTTLARFHSRLLLANGYEVIVYDPVETETFGGGWSPEKGSQALLFTDRTKFLEHVQKASNAYVFVDESADIFAQNMQENQWMLRKGRHSGLFVRVIVQRPKMVAPNVRTQCAVAFLFRLAREDMREYFADFGHSGAQVSEYADELDVGDFLILESGRPTIETHNVFDVVD